MRCQDKGEEADAKSLSSPWQSPESPKLEQLSQNGLILQKCCCCSNTNPHASGQRDNVRDAAADSFAWHCAQTYYSKLEGSAAQFWSPLLWGLFRQRASDIRGRWSQCRQMAQIWPRFLLSGWAIPQTKRERDLTKLPSLSGLGEEFCTRPIEAVRSQLDHASCPVWSEELAGPVHNSSLAITHVTKAPRPPVLQQWPLSAHPSCPALLQELPCSRTAVKKVLLGPSRQCGHHHQSLVSGVIWKTYTNVNIGWLGQLRKNHRKSHKMGGGANCACCCPLTPWSSRWTLPGLRLSQLTKQN